MKDLIYKTINPPNLVKDWLGKTIKTKREMSNGCYIISEGTIMLIDNSGPVVGLTGADKCPSCDVKPIISIKGDKEYKLMFFEFIEITGWANVSDDIPGANSEIKEYKPINPPKLISDWVNKPVISKKEIKNYFITIPAGTLMQIYAGAGKTVSVIAEKCPVCGIQKRAEIKGAREEKLAYIDFINKEYEKKYESYKFKKY